MTDDELLAEVKKRIGVTGTYQDDTIKGHIVDVKDFMSDAGVSESVMQSNHIIGAVTRGVSDLWNYGAGGGNFSTFFYQRVSQLCYANIDEETTVTVEQIDTLLGVSHE